MISLKVHRGPAGSGVTFHTVRPERAGMEHRFRMAGGAFRRDLELSRRMALRAFHQRMFPGQREGAGIMVKGNVFPASRNMTERTILPELSVVMIVPCMA